MPATQPTTLPPLARVVRGLSALFWGLPLNLLLAARTATAESWMGIGALPACLAAALILFGLHELSAFQPQERIWVRQLERARLLAWLHLAFSPAAFWFNRRPAEPYFQHLFSAEVFAGMVLLLALNHLLRRLVAMLPDETLRLEIRHFTRINITATWLLIAGYAAWLLAGAQQGLPGPINVVLDLAASLEPSQLILPALIPVALTMTMIWKSKETILASLFHP